MTSNNMYYNLEDADTHLPQSSSDEESSTRTKRSRIVFVIGPKGGGKSEVVNQIKKQLKNCSVVSVDKILAVIANSTPTAIYTAL